MKRKQVFITEVNEIYQKLIFFFRALCSHLLALAEFANFAYLSSVTCGQGPITNRPALQIGSSIVRLRASPLFKSEFTEALFNAAWLFVGWLSVFSTLSKVLPHLEMSVPIHHALQSSLGSILAISVALFSILNKPFCEEFYQLPFRTLSCSVDDSHLLVHPHFPVFTALLGSHFYVLS